MITAAAYLISLLLVFAAAFQDRCRSRQVAMLAASYVFYATGGIGFLAVLVASSCLNFALGEYLRRKPDLKRLWIGILFNVLLLSFFKYLPSFGSAAVSTSWTADLLNRVAVPVGISFWTLLALSYLFDVYREEEINPSLLEFCLYMAFWPTVIMGPICRLSTMLPQFQQVRGVAIEDVLAGARRIGIGLLMKVVLSQLLASGLSGIDGVAAGFDREAQDWGGFDVWFLAVGFGFQLFFDFAAFSHIVIGAARIFGFRLDENFNSPYLSSTPSEFWTRWHMSLSFWIRDYVFIPMAALRRGTLWRYFMLLFSMILFGLWHGAKATFILWGAYSGALLVLHRVSQQLQRRWGLNFSSRLAATLSWAVSFLAVSLGWVFFRANTLDQALRMVQTVLAPVAYSRFVLPQSYYVLVSALVIGYFAIESISKALASRSVLVSSPNTATDFNAVSPFLWNARWWWLSPMIGALLLFHHFVVSTTNVDLTPFVYRLF